MAAAALLTVPLNAAPALAHGHRHVRLAVTTVPVELDAGYQVAAVCEAQASSDVRTDVPAATVVTCSINGVTASRGLPGGESYVAVTNTVAGSSYTVCVSGQAAFADAVADDIGVVSEGPHCDQVSL